MPEKTIVIVNDPHIGSSVGLCTPTVELPEGGTYHASRGQRELYDQFTQLSDRVGTLPNPVLIVNGDALDMDNKNRSYQMITRNKAAVLELAAKTLDPIIKAAGGYVYFTRGTPAHTGKSGWSEEDLAKDFDAIRTPAKQYSWDRLYLQVSGIKFDIQHQAPMGQNPDAAAENLAKRIVQQYWDTGEQPPDYVIRSHNHTWGESRSHRTKAIFTPALCLVSEYALRSGHKDLADLGALLIHCDVGKSEIEKIRFRVGRRVWQRL